MPKDIRRPTSGKCEFFGVSLYWAFCHLGRNIHEGSQLDGAAHKKPERVEDYCEGSEAMDKEEHFQRIEKVGRLTTASLRGSVGIYETMTARVEKISSDLANNINGLVTSSCKRWLKMNGRNGITCGMKSECTNISPETSASPATPKSRTQGSYSIKQ